MAGLADLRPASYRPHAVHGAERIWSETNCYTDVWIELLHALGAEPLAVAAFCLSADFEGTQWSFFKPPIEDLREQYGIEVTEMNVWRPVIDHLEEEMSLGRLLTIEVDSWYLPDTAGVAYRNDHVKTTIVPVAVSRAERRLRYLHGPGLHHLEGDDFDGLFAPVVLPPYVELIRLDDLRPTTGRSAGDAATTSLALARRHLGRRPATNPVLRLGRRLEAVAPWLSEQGDPQTFHLLAFGTCRQCGATAELAASYLDWLADRTGLDMGDAADLLRDVAQGAKALQFSLARAARGRRVDIPADVAPLASAWDRALDTVTGAVGLR